MKNSFVMLLAVLFLSSCSERLTPFTQELYQSQNWSDNDLKRIQFYLSEDLVLYRDAVEATDSKITGGEIKIKNGRKIEELRIPRSTPGIFIFRPDSDHFGVSFEKGDDTRYLMFGPNPKRGGTYEMLASEWNRKSGKVNYSGTKFQTQSESIPALLVNVEYKKTKKVSRKTASGRKIE